MNFLKDRRVILGLGGALALAAGLLLAWVFLIRDHAPPEAPPASQGGLVVESGRDDDLKLDPKRPLRCFVNGQFVGELPLAECAQRNGVATGALDVGLDPSGSLAASNGVGADITPLPPQQPEPVTEMGPPANEAAPGSASSAASVVATPVGPQADVAQCLRFVLPGGWKALPTPMTRGACLTALFAGRCQAGEPAAYGRWGDETLRLTDGRIETSPDSRDFHTVIDPWIGCVTTPPM